MTTLDVDVDAILRLARRPSDGPTEVVIRTPRPVGEVVEIVTRAWTDPRMLRAGRDEVDLDSLRYSSTGVVAGLAPHSMANFGSWLDAWGGVLAENGVVGSVAPFRFTKPPFTYPAEPMFTVTAALVFAGTGGEVGGARRVPIDVDSSFTELAVEWCLASAGDVHLCHEFTCSRLEPEEIATGVLGMIADARALGAPISLHWSQGRALRTVGWDESGHAWLQVADARPWLWRLRELEAIVGRFAADLVYAGIRSSKFDQLSWGDAWHEPTRSPSAAVHGYTEIVGDAEEVSFVLDACGLQLLSDDQLARANDLSGWGKRRLGDVTWVEAPDLAPWFAEPDPSVLAHARSDFGAMILTVDQIVAAHRRARQVMT